MPKHVSHAVKILVLLECCNEVCSFAASFSPLPRLLVADRVACPSPNYFGNSVLGSRATRALRRPRQPQMQLDPAHVHLSAVVAAAATNDASKYFIAGGACASISHGWTVPIDVVKTRMQTDPDLRGEGMFRATRTIVRSDGGKTLFTGLGSTLIGYAIQGSLKYGCYEAFKPIAKAATSGNPLLALVVAASSAELIGSSFLCPLEATRIRLVADPSFGSEVFDALPRLLSEKGISIFSSLPAILGKMVPYTVTQLVSYDLLTREAYTLLASSDIPLEPAVSLAVSLACSLVAAVLSSLASQPGDSLLSELNKGGSHFGTSPLEIMRAMRFQDYFSGTSARLVHMAAIVSTQLVIYDVIKQLVGLPPTGAA